MLISNTILKLTTQGLEQGLTPLETHANLEWMFKILEKAPYRLPLVNFINIDTEDSCSFLSTKIKGDNLKAEKLFNILAETSYRSYEIVYHNGDSFEYSKQSSSTMGDGVHQDLVHLLNMFADE